MPFRTCRSPQFPANSPTDASEGGSHHGGDCSFETFLRRYELGDPVLWEIAKVVHEADLADERYDAPEASGLDVMLRGLSMVRDDEELLALSGPLFDGLYEYRKRALLTGREPA